MSKLDTLISELCPEGVEFLELEQISSYRRGSFPQPYTNLNFYGGDGAMPFVQVADMRDDSFLLSSTTKQTISLIAQPKSVFVPRGTILVSIQGTLGRVAITQFDAYVDRTIAIFFEYDKRLDKKFFAYMLKQKFDFEKKYARGSTLKTITKEEFSKFKIPVPPLDVQREIVRILDSFLNLSSELMSELVERRKQYDFYKDKLLDFSDYDENDIKYLHLSEIVEFKNGKGHEQSISDFGEYIVVNSKFISSDGQVIKFTEDQICPVFKNDILMVMSDLPNGKALAKCFVVDEDMKYSLNQRIGCFSIVDPTLIDTVFLYHVLNRNKQLLRFDNGVDQTNLRKDDILNILIPIPKLTVQKAIANYLTTMQSYCFDLNNGLPAEIEARRKQYEYYRDLLTSFKEKSQ